MFTGAAISSCYTPRRKIELRGAYCSETEKERYRKDLRLRAQTLLLILPHFKFGELFSGSEQEHYSINKTYYVCFKLEI